jgi:hypothetical protein
MKSPPIVASDAPNAQYNSLWYFVGCTNIKGVKIMM